MRHHQNYGKRHNPHTSRRVWALPETALRHICFLHNIPVRAELLHTGMSTLSAIQEGGRVIVHSPESIRNVLFYNLYVTVYISLQTYRSECKMDRK